MKIHPVFGEFTDGQMVGRERPDRTKLTAALRSFANAPKNSDTNIREALYILLYSC